MNKNFVRLLQCGFYAAVITITGVRTAMTNELSGPF